MDRARAIAEIAANIAKFGCHVYSVHGSASPRYAYTIGLTEVLGPELCLAGALFYSRSEAHEILERIRSQLRDAEVNDVPFQLSSLGAFTLRPMHRSWVETLLLGAVDYYRSRHVTAYQVVPDTEHWTLDVPDLSIPYGRTTHPAWRWHHDEWPYAAAKQSVAITNLTALRGSPISEAARWELDEWEMFAGPGADVAREDVRVVPLGVMLGLDDSLDAVARLDVGKALHRNDDGSGDWVEWKRRLP